MSTLNSHDKRTTSSPIARVARTKLRKEHPSKFLENNAFRNHQLANLSPPLQQTLIAESVTSRAF